MPLAHYTVMEKILITKLAQVSQSACSFLALFNYVNEAMFYLFIYYIIS